MSKKVWGVGLTFFLLFFFAVHTWTWRLYDWIGPVQWGWFSVKRTICCMSCVTRHLSPVYSILCSFSCYDSPKRPGQAAAWGLVIKWRNKNKFVRWKLFIFFFSSQFIFGQFKEEHLGLKDSIPIETITLKGQTNKQTDWISLGAGVREMIRFCLIGNLYFWEGGM